MVDWLIDWDGVGVGFGFGVADGMDGMGSIGHKTNTAVVLFSVVIHYLTMVIP